MMAKNGEVALRLQSGGVTIHFGAERIFISSGRRYDRSLVAEEECDSPEVILDLLGAGPCSAAEAGEALPQRVVEAREMVGVACFLRDGLVTLSRDDTLGDVLLIG